MTISVNQLFATGINHLVAISDNAVKASEAQLKSKMDLIRSEIKRSDMLRKNQKPLDQIQEHEKEHFYIEIESLIKHDLVDKVTVLSNGLDIRLKPVHCYKGYRSYGVLIRPENGRRTIFIDYGNNNVEFDLGCLDGNRHNQVIANHIAKLRFVEAAFVAIDLINSGIEGQGAT